MEVAVYQPRHQQVTLGINNPITSLCRHIPFRRDGGDNGTVHHHAGPIELCVHGVHGENAGIVKNCFHGCNVGLGFRARNILCGQGCTRTGSATPREGIIVFTRVARGQ